MRYEHIFWDWNGTLLDDAEPTLDAVNAMLKNRSKNPITLEEYRDMIDVPIINFYKKVMDISDKTMEEISEEFHGFYSYYLQSDPLSPEAPDILKKLSELGCKQYIFSSSENRLIEPFLARYGIDRYFKKVLGATDCHVGSKIERTAYYFEKKSLPKEKCVFIGDMVHDCDTADYIGCDCILVSCGHQSEKALRATGREVVSSLSELLEHII